MEGMASGLDYTGEKTAENRYGRNAIQTNTRREQESLQECTTRYLSTKLGSVTYRPKSEAKSHENFNSNEQSVRTTSMERSFMIIDKKSGTFLTDLYDELSPSLLSKSDVKECDQNLSDCNRNYDGAKTLDDPGGAKQGFDAKKPSIISSIRYENDSTFDGHPVVFGSLREIVDLYQGTSSKATDLKRSSNSFGSQIEKAMQGFIKISEHSNNQDPFALEANVEELFPFFDDDDTSSTNNSDGPFDFDVLDSETKVNSQSSRPTSWSDTPFSFERPLLTDDDFHPNLYRSVKVTDIDSLFMDNINKEEKQKETMEEEEEDTFLKDNIFETEEMPRNKRTLNVEQLSLCSDNCNVFFNVEEAITPEESPRDKVNVNTLFLEDCANEDIIVPIIVSRKYEFFGDFLVNEAISSTPHADEVECSYGWNFLDFNNDRTTTCGYQYSNGRNNNLDDSKTEGDANEPVKSGDSSTTCSKDNDQRQDETLDEDNEKENNCAVHEENNVVGAFHVDGKEENGRYIANGMNVNRDGGGGSGGSVFVGEYDKGGGCSRVVEYNSGSRYSDSGEVEYDSCGGGGAFAVGGGCSGVGEYDSGRCSDSGEVECDSGGVAVGGGCNGDGGSGVAVSGGGCSGGGGGDCNGDVGSGGGGGDCSSGQSAVIVGSEEIEVVCVVQDDCAVVNTSGVSDTNVGGCEIEVACLQVNSEENSSSVSNNNNYPGSNHSGSHFRTCNVSVSGQGDGNTDANVFEDNNFRSFEERQEEDFSSVIVYPEMIVKSLQSTDSSATEAKSHENSLSNDVSDSQAVASQNCKDEMNGSGIFVDSVNKNTEENKGESFEDNRIMDRREELCADVCADNGDVLDNQNNATDVNGTHVCNDDVTISGDVVRSDINVDLIKVEREEKADNLHEPESLETDDVGKDDGCREETVEDVQQQDRKNSDVIILIDRADQNGETVMYTGDDDHNIIVESEVGEIINEQTCNTKSATKKSTTRTLSGSTSPEESANSRRKSSESDSDHLRMLKNATINDQLLKSNIPRTAEDEKSTKNKPGNLSENNRNGLTLSERILNVNRSIDWVRSVIMEMRAQDLSLKIQFDGLREEIRNLQDEFENYGVNCDYYQEDELLNLENLNCKTEKQKTHINTNAALREDSGYHSDASSVSDSKDDGKGKVANVTKAKYLYEPIPSFPKVQTLTSSKCVFEIVL